ncbi:hypothetical protein [Pseudoalteromonas rubra]|uniref:Uncharacterized protein n=1 Tax=Pseudoalteromonas rubra TaxID=43658 RepID=A0A0U2ZE74_9GAMM|nr:hypothetical protein [Pseudoalteromonas rubra]ALU46113.1 hypothetical protein AT705_24435 [Pseudoalteromonas rubra]
MNIQHVLSDSFLSLNQPKESFLYAVVSDFLSQSFAVSEIKSFQWLEAALECASKEVYKQIEHGTYLFPTYKERLMGVITDYLVSRIGCSAEQLAEHLELELHRYCATPMECAAGELMSDILEHQAYWLCEFLCFIYCLENHIDTRPNEVYLNGRYSVFADAHNERLKIHQSALRLMERGQIEVNDYKDLELYFADFFMLLFSKDEVLQRRIANGIKVS